MSDARERAPAAPAGAASDELQLLAETARSIFSAHCDTETVDAAISAGGSERLWSTLEESGLTMLSVPEAAGGGGGSLSAAAVLLRVAGEFAAPVPLGQTCLLGAPLLASAGLPLPYGPISACCGDGAVTVTREGSGWRARGRLQRVPWARTAARIAVCVPDPELVFALEPGKCELEIGHNIAAEPRDDVIVDALVSDADVAPAPPGSGQVLRRRGALARTLGVAGAAERALELTLHHVTEREQFGRPIARFQAVQQQVAELAGEVTAIGAAAEAAVRACQDQGFASDAAVLPVAAAKARASEGAGTVARITHQLHGAIGFTAEHALRLATTRLWAWRDEYGNEATWQQDLGDRAVHAGAEGLWPLITETL